MRPEDLLHSTINSRYRLTRYIGEGGSSLVFAASRVDSGKVQNCAVRLYREQRPVLPNVRLAASCQHPSLLRFLGLGEVISGEAAGHLYLATELADTSLAERLAETRPLPTDELKAVARAVAEVLTFLHEKDVAHLAIKPSNIFRVGGEWKVGDLGLLPGGSAGLLGVLLDHDTLPYLAPEALRGEMGPEMDLWSLGAVLQECAGGAVPYDGRNAAEVMMKMAGGNPRLTSGLPWPFDIIVQGCLMKDVSRRWVAAQVLAVLEGRPALGVGGAPERESSRRKSGKFIVKEARSVNAPAEVLAVAASPDLAQVAASTSEGTIRLIRVTDGEVAWQAEPNESPVTGLAFTPDGKYVVVGGWDGSARVLERGNGQVHTLCVAPEAVLRLAAAGTWIYGTSSDGHVCGWKDLAAEPTWKVALPRAFAIHAEGDVLAVGTLDGRVLRWPLTDGEPGEAEHLRSHGGPVWDVRVSQGAVVSASWDRTVLMQKPGEALRTVEVGCGVWAVDVREGQVAVAAEDKCVIVYHLSMEEAMRLVGHQGAVQAVAWGEGRNLISGARDRLIRIWELPQNIAATAG
ncbi:MAG: protein kinase domain-containing protein [Candidatus Xenobia bacterium]